MKIYLSLKSVSKRKNFITKDPYELPAQPHTLRELLTLVVSKNVEHFNNYVNNPETPLSYFLSHSDIEEQAEIGKVGFKAIYSDKQANLKNAIKTAIQAFEDGLFRVFIDNEEAERLDTLLHIADGAEVAFIRLTMLTGRMW